jgi:hypothetical protein
MKKSLLSANPSEPSSDNDANTGLPGLKSWRAVYLFVLGFFVLWVVVLAVWSRVLA